MKIHWNDGSVGCVVDVYPRNMALIWAMPKSSWDPIEVMLDLNRTDHRGYKLSLIIRVLDPGPGWRVVEDSEPILRGDEVFTSDGWISAPPGYSGQRETYMFRRKINA